MPPTVQPPDDEDYFAIVDSIKKGRCVPFLGAGANLCGHSPSDWDATQQKVLPLGSQLAGWLAEEFNYPLGRDKMTCSCHQQEHEIIEKPVDLLRISQYVVLQRDKGPLGDRLDALFDRDYPTTDLHKFLARIPNLLKTQGFHSPHILVVTTNYDDLMERAFGEAGEETEIVYYAPARTKKGKRVEGTFMRKNGDSAKPLRRGETISLKTSSIVFKIHGTVDRSLNRPANSDDTYVITEDDYIDYLTRTDLVYPTGVMAALNSSSFLFLGYGLRDWNLRAFFNRIWKSQARSYKSWSIQYKPDSLEARFWEEREVKVFSQDLVTFVEQLRVRTGILLDSNPATTK